jgi:hypothetical protein
MKDNQDKRVALKVNKKTGEQIPLTAEELRVEMTIQLRYIADHIMLTTDDEARDFFKDDLEGLAEGLKFRDDLAAMVRSFADFYEKLPTFSDQHDGVWNAFFNQVANVVRCGPDAAHLAVRGLEAVADLSRNPHQFVRELVDDLRGKAGEAPADNPLTPADVDRLYEESFGNPSVGDTGQVDRLFGEAKHQPSFEKHLAATLGPQPPKNKLH